MIDSNHPFNRPEFTLKKHLPKKRLIVIVGVVLLSAVVGGVLYFFRENLFNASQEATPDTSQQLRDDVDETALSKAVASANTHVADGDTTKAVQVIDEAIEATNSPAQKAALYRNKATVIANKDTPAAIKAAEQSVALSPNFENTAYLAELYERNGDTEKAIEYYGKTIALFNQIKRAEQGGPVDASLYQMRIDRLRGQ